MRNLYCTALFIQWSDESSKYERPILSYSFSDLRNSMVLRNLYWTTSFIQWSEESSAYEIPIPLCFIYSVIWGILWNWGTYTELLHLFNYLRIPVNLTNLYWTALFIQLSEQSSASEVPIIYCFMYSVIWGIQWIWGTYTELLYLFSNLRNPVHLKNPYCTASFIQWSEKSSESEVPLLYCFINSVRWGIQWIWGINTELLYLFSDWGIQCIWGTYTDIYCIYSVI